MIPSPRRTNAIWPPSGDQAGLTSEDGASVRRRRASPPTALIQMCGTPLLSGSAHSNATKLPSGDREGGPSTPGYAVSGVAADIFVGVLRNSKTAAVKAA